MDADDIDRIRAHVRRYDFEDGLNELAVGGFAAVVGGLGLVLPHSVLQSGSLLLVMGPAFLAEQWVLKRGRERLTYPRTGVAVPSRRPGVALVSGLVVAAVAMLLAGRLVRPGPGLGAGYVALGVVMAISFLFLAVWRGLPRLAVAGLVVIGCTLALAWAHVPEGLATSLVLVGSGVALLASGGFALMRYLKRTRPFAEECDGGD